MSQEDMGAADRRTNQRHALVVLSEVLAEAASRKLPPLPWMASATGARVIGTEPLGTPARISEAFEAWAGFLGASPTRAGRPSGHTALDATVCRDGVEVVLSFVVPPACRECGVAITPWQHTNGRDCCAEHGGTEVPDATS